MSIILSKETTRLLKICLECCHFSLLTFKIKSFSFYPKTNMCLTARCLPLVLQWTPFGFKMRDPDTLDDLSKERFEGTVLKAISKNIKIKEEPREEPVGAPFVPV